MKYHDISVKCLLKAKRDKKEYKAKGVREGERERERAMAA